ncbi:MAG TPA: hypothetical protein VH092_12515 [Urbifossiella sp.]|nr:hypothetical protein [Urbifossiella sp.]
MFIRLFDPKQAPLFLLGAVAVAVLGNAVSDIAKKRIGEEPGDLVWIAACSLGVLATATLGLWAWHGRPARILPPDRARPCPRPGLVLLVSVGQTDTVRAAAAHHRPVLKHVWLVCSPQSAPAAAQLAGDPEFAAGVKVETVVVDDVYEPRGVFDAVAGVFRRLPAGWGPADVAADYTGLTASASVGLVLAALQAGVAIQYTPAERDQTGRPIRPLPPFEMVFTQGDPAAWEPVAPVPKASAAG